MEELLNLILENKKVFTDTVVHRQSTSFYNRGLHQDVLNAIEMDHYDKMVSTLSNKWYRKPLKSVMVCMDNSLIDTDTKLRMMQLVEEMPYDLGNNSI